MEEEKFFALKALYSGLMNNKTWNSALILINNDPDCKRFVEKLEECLVDPPLSKKRCVCTIVGVAAGGQNIEGKVTFKQESVYAPVAIDVEIKGLAPGKHGFHVHEFGGEGWNSAGPHFNPLNKNHGAPIAKIRHIGDLGNVRANEDGVVEIGFSDRGISLSGPYNVVGRMLCIDAFADDFGHGIDADKEESLISGNSGPIIACGIIAWAQP